MILVIQGQRTRLVKLHCTGGDPVAFVRVLQLASPDILHVRNFLKPPLGLTEEDLLWQITTRFKYLKRHNKWYQFDRHMGEFFEKHATKKHSSLLNRSFVEATEKVEAISTKDTEGTEEVA